MNKWMISVLILACGICLFASSCTMVVGTGAVIEKDYDLTDFDSIDVSHAIKYDITYDDEYKVTVKTHENVFKHLDIRTSGDTLVVHLKPNTNTSSDIHVTITLPELNALDASGATRGNISGFKSTQPLSIDLSGASNLSLDATAGRTRFDISGASKMTGSLTADEFYLDLSGASRCEIEGSAEDSDMTISGASNLFGLDFETRYCSFNVSGASHGRIYCSSELDIEVSGASTVTYSGNPEIKSVDVSGASRIEKD